MVDTPGSLNESIGLKAVDKTPHTLLFHLKKIFKQVETTNRSEYIKVFDRGAFARSHPVVRTIPHGFFVMFFMII